MEVSDMEIKLIPSASAFPLEKTFKQQRNILKESDRQRNVSKHYANFWPKHKLKTLKLTFVVTTVNSC